MLEHSAGRMHAGGWTGTATEDTRAETLQLLREVNERCLRLMGRSFDSEWVIDVSLLDPLRAAWRNADAAGLARAASFPALLLDIRGWDGSAGTNDSHWFFPEHLALPLMRSTLMLAWHVCRTERQAAGFLLGLPSESVGAFRQMGLHDLEQVAQTRAHCLQPRWSHTPSIWIELLMAARVGGSQNFDTFKLRVLQRMLGEFLPPPAMRNAGRSPPGARARNGDTPPA
jgi:hypothetical protein